MKYENATDLELNRKLHENLGSELPEIDGVWVIEDRNRTVKTDPNGGINRVILHPDYCTDWNATMPLAVEHGLYYTRDTCQTHVKTYFYDESISFSCSQSSLLRGMVICLIKALEAESAKETI